jgi:hypothetical protein
LREIDIVADIMQVITNVESRPQAIVDTSYIDDKDDVMYGTALMYIDLVSTDVNRLNSASSTLVKYLNSQAGLKVTGNSSEGV